MLRLLPPFPRSAFVASLHAGRLLGRPGHRRLPPHHFAEPCSERHVRQLPLTGHVPRRQLQLAVHHPGLRGAHFRVQDRPQRRLGNGARSAPWQRRSAHVWGAHRKRYWRCCMLRIGTTAPLPPLPLRLIRSVRLLLLWRVGAAERGSSPSHCPFRPCPLVAS